MCTAIAWRCQDTYFGRNLDLERDYGEQVVITPRRFPLKMRCVPALNTHYAMIGMAAVAEDFPLYFEATNERGLSMAGLNFPGNALYCPVTQGADNIAPFEFIPWILGQCATLAEVRRLTARIRLTDLPFSRELPVTPLHWIISDKTGSLVAESLEDGFHLWENPFDILTNSPPFHYHRTHLCNYMALHTGPADNRFDSALPLKNYSLGMGALGLPGDFSSASRFVRGFFVKENALSGPDEQTNVRQFFHILNSVAMPRGCVWTPNGYEYTRYSCCCNASRGIYYYTTYDDFGVTAIDLRDGDPDGHRLYTCRARKLS